MGNHSLVKPDNFTGTLIPIVTFRHSRAGRNLIVFKFSTAANANVTVEFANVRDYFISFAAQCKQLYQNFTTIRNSSLSFILCF